MRTATEFERRVIKLRAIPLGVYPSCFAARRTRLCISEEADAPVLNTRDTADCETPARIATS